MKKGFLDRFDEWRVSQAVANWVTRVTGSMFFFALALLFIVVMRVLEPPPVSQLLLDIENDLQLLLLAANAVVSGTLFAMILSLLKHISQMETNQIDEMEAIRSLLKTASADIQEMRKDVDEIADDVNDLREDDEKSG